MTTEKKQLRSVLEVNLERIFTAINRLDYTSENYADSIKASFDESYNRREKNNTERLNLIGKVQNTAKVLEDFIDRMNTDANILENGILPVRKFRIETGLRITQVAEDILEMAKQQKIKKVPKLGSIVSEISNYELGKITKGKMVNLYGVWLKEKGYSPDDKTANGSSDEDILSMWRS